MSGWKPCLFLIYLTIWYSFGVKRKEKFSFAVGGLCTRRLPDATYLHGRGARARADMSDAALDIDALQRAVDGLRSQQESVQRERAELQSMKAVVDANLAQFKQRVKLNVGGSKFETTLSTLTRYPDSMLGAMFSGRHEVPPDPEGYVFIDRDGTHFRAILNFLRTGFIDNPHPAQAANELKRELEYYQLPSDGLVKPQSSARTLELVRTFGSPFETSAHKRDVEAKLKANPQLKIISSHIRSEHAGPQSSSNITTILATADAYATSPSTSPSTMASPADLD